MLTPRELVTLAGVDTWLMVLGAGILATIAVWLLVQLGLQFPRNTLVEYGPLLLGRPAGRLLGITIGVYFLSVVGMMTRVGADMVKMFLLERTPIEVIMATSIIIVVYAVLKGLPTLARMAEFITLGGLPLLVIVLFLAVKEIDLGFVMPVMRQGLAPFRVFPIALIPFLGFEALYFIIPFAEKSQEVLKASIAGIAAAVILYVLIYLLLIGTFGAAEITFLVYPVLTMIRTLEFREIFVERLESIMMVVWLPFLFTQMGISYLSGSISLAQSLGLPDYRLVAWLVAPLVFLEARMPANTAEVTRWLVAIGFSGIAIAYVLPGLLLAVTLLRGKRGNHGHVPLESD